MTREEFMNKMQDVLQTEAALVDDTVLMDLDEWDSLSMMATMAFADKNFGIKLSMADFRAMNTMADLAAKLGV